MPASMPDDFKSFVCLYFTHRSSWWSQSGSNRRPPACKAGALPAELWPRFSEESAQGCAVLIGSSRRDPREVMVGLGGLEPPASPLSGVRSNHLSYRPRDRAPEPTPASVELTFAAAVDEESGHGWPVLMFALRKRDFA